MTTCNMDVPAVATAERIAELQRLWDSFDDLPLSKRIVKYVRALRARGDDAFARSAHYLARNVSASATAATYDLTLDRRARQFVVCSIEHPAAAEADIIAQALRVRGFDHVDKPALCDAWMDNEASEDPRELPHPLVIGTGDAMQIDVTGSNMNTTGILVRGYHVDDVTAEVIKAAGELFVEGLNHSFSAAAVMEKQLDRLFTHKKRITHLVAKETRTGDAVRVNVNFQIRGERLFPKEGKVIPPLSLRKPMAQLDMDIQPDDSLLLDLRYTSAGGAGTAKLQCSFFGRRRF